MAQVKSSLAPEGEPIAFELNKETGFRFIGKYDISIDDLLNGVATTSKLEQAEKLLRDMLSERKLENESYCERFFFSKTIWVPAACRRSSNGVALYMFCIKTIEL